MSRTYIERRLDHLEALGCWVLGYLADGWPSTVWFVLGFMALFNVWAWIGRVAARRVAS